MKTVMQVVTIFLKLSIYDSLCFIFLGYQFFLLQGERRPITTHQQHVIQFTMRIDSVATFLPRLAQNV